MSEPIAIWRPSLWVFALRFLALGTVTALVFSPFPFFAGLSLLHSFWIVAAFLLLSPLILGLIFDDHTNWMRHRREAWALYPDRLEFRDGAEPPFALPLSRIASLSTRWTYSLAIRTTDGSVVFARYIANVARMRRLILSQQTALLAEPSA